MYILIFYQNTAHQSNFWWLDFFTSFTPSSPSYHCLIIYSVEISFPWWEIWLNWFIFRWYLDGLLRVNLVILWNFGHFVKFLIFPFNLVFRVNIRYLWSILTCFSIVMLRYVLGDYFLQELSRAQIPPFWVGYNFAHFWYKMIWLDVIIVILITIITYIDLLIYYRLISHFKISFVIIYIVLHY